MTRVLIVEDEPAIAELIAVNVRHAGFDPDVVSDGIAAQASMDRALPDLVLLDWMLPGASGATLARRWRMNPRTRSLPIIMLTAKGDEADKVAGLDAGADDYVTKPFSPNELMARIKALLRRNAPQSAELPVEAAGIKLDPSTHRVTALTADGRDQVIKLGPTEFKLLHYFLSHAQRVHSRAQLLDKVWGDHVFIEERTIDVHVKRLREALSVAGRESAIETVRGVGYRLAG